MLNLSVMVTVLQRYLKPSSAGNLTIQLLVIVCGLLDIRIKGTILCTLFSAVEKVVSLRILKWRGYDSVIM